MNPPAVYIYYLSHQFLLINFKIFLLLQLMFKCQGNLVSHAQKTFTNKTPNTISIAHTSF